MTSFVHLPEELNSYINKWKTKKGSLIMILRAIQDYYGYVPKDMSFMLAKELKIPLARIYEVLTFYNYFKLNAPGKNRISVCTGTACFLKGASNLINILENKLNIKEGQTTKDNLFTLETVRCMGCCGLAPNVRINEKIYGKLDKDKIPDVLSKYQEKNG